MTGARELNDEYVRQGGLLVPVDAVTDPVAAVGLRAELAAARDLVAVQREDERERRAQEAEHRIAMADVDEHAAAAKRARQDRARDAKEADALGRLYRRAARSGTRARIRAQIQGSAEMRVLRIAAVRKVTLAAGLPVLAAFAAWSTTGAQAGTVRLLNLSDGSAAWAASWAVEPALITIVALIIIGRAVLRSSGGDTDARATAVEWTALAVSLALNIIGGWHGGWDGLATALPHAIGPLGCAGTAYLIGLFDSYVTAARPLDGAPTLADLNLVPDVPDTAPVPQAPVPLVMPVPHVVPEAAPVPAVVAVPDVSTGQEPARTGRAVAVPATRRRVISARTGPVPAETGTAKATARAFWDAEVAAGRIPTGPQLARAAGRDNDDSGLFRRCARQWAGELAGTAVAGGRS